MEIVIISQGLPFGPDTIENYSLGGSETAALQMAKELRAKDHLVTVFCNLPPAGRDDYIQPGSQDAQGIRWVSIEQAEPFIANTEIDLLIVSRNPDFFNSIHQAKKAVLWCHDLATYKGFLPRLMSTAWNFDEVWCVSEYHKQQIHDVTGYPLKSIRTTRNGVVKFDGLMELPKIEKSLLYSARPERGLIHLVKEGGIMEKLPDYTLSVTMYDNYPEHMMEFYNYLWARCRDLPNVELLGSKTQRELRQIMNTTWLYVYPTEFEEVSCILARECIEQKVPFLTTKVGALPETLGSCGYYMDKTAGEEGFVEDFAEAVEYLDACPAVMEGLMGLAEKRDDLYWPDVADQWVDWSEPKEPSTYSLIHSLISDSDIIPAIAVMNELDQKDDGKGLRWLSKELNHQYPFLHGRSSFAEYYRGIYELEDSKDVRERKEMVTIGGSQRYAEIAKHITSAQDCKRVLEYGCAEGPVILQLAQDFPEVEFHGVDFVEDNIRLCKQYAKENDIKNAWFSIGSTERMPRELTALTGTFDVVIVAEVLEHVEKPWEVATTIEGFARLGGKLVLTVPQGSWEMGGLKNLTQWHWRAHIWHINKWMLRNMFRDKKDCLLSSLTEGMDSEGRARGHLAMSFTVDHSPAHPIDPLEKAKQHRSRQTLAACMIAMNDDDQILNCLNSIEKSVDVIQIALGPCDDHTYDYITSWAKEHPWVDFRIVDVPKIEAKKYGFDDARNASIEGIESDWILWIDSDEYLSGETMKMHCRNNCFDSYAIHQHHFTCDPRGAPTQLDKPARLIRNHHGFKFYGKVHEHAEMGFNGGPGFVMLVSNVDIGHTGYVNEAVRRSRFGRNYPLLEWDHEVYPDRNLGKYLWLRDIIHRMRIIDERGDKNEARRLAEEALSFYTENLDAMSGVGSGSVAGNKALDFYSEAMNYLGRGHQIGVQMTFDGQTAGYEGIFENEVDAFELAQKGLAEEIRKRKSGYWQ